MRRGLVSAALLLSMSGCYAPPSSPPTYAQPGYPPGYGSPQPDGPPPGYPPPPPGYAGGGYDPYGSPYGSNVYPGYSYNDGSPTLFVEGAAVPLVVFGGGWGYWDSRHSWHRAPDAVSRQLEQQRAHGDSFHHGGEGIYPAAGGFHPPPGGSRPGESDFHHGGNDFHHGENGHPTGPGHPEHIGAAQPGPEGHPSGGPPHGESGFHPQEQSRAPAMPAAAPRPAFQQPAPQQSGHEDRGHEDHGRGRGCAPGQHC